MEGPNGVDHEKDTFLPLNFARSSMEVDHPEVASVCARMRREREMVDVLCYFYFCFFVIM